MILGLDISSSKVGIAVIDENKKIIMLKLVKFEKESLENKALVLSEEFKQIKKKYKIKDVFIEEPISIYARGKSTAHVISVLQRFNGMCSLMCRLVYGDIPTLINSRKARTLADVKIPGRLKSKEIKKIIIEEMSKRYQKDFPTPKTKFGNYKPGTDDKADALVIALAGHKLISLDNLTKKMYI